jgi:hypothetical protein
MDDGRTPGSVACAGAGVAAGEPLLDSAVCLEIPTFLLRNAMIGTMSDDEITGKAFDFVRLGDLLADLSLPDPTKLGLYLKPAITGILAGR